MHLMNNSCQAYVSEILPTLLLRSQHRCMETTIDGRLKRLGRAIARRRLAAKLTQTQLGSEVLKRTGDLLRRGRE